MQAAANAGAGIVASAFGNLKRCSVQVAKAWQPKLLRCDMRRRKRAWRDAGSARTASGCKITKVGRLLRRQRQGEGPGGAICHWHWRRDVCRKVLDAVPV